MVVSISTQICLYIIASHSGIYSLSFSVPWQRSLVTVYSGQTSKGKYTHANQMVRKPNAHMCRWNCEYALCHVWMVRILFAADIFLWFANQMRICVDGTANMHCAMCEWFVYCLPQTLFVFCANTKGIGCAVYPVSALGLWKTNS